MKKKKLQREDRGKDHHRGRDCQTLLKNPLWENLPDRLTLPAEEAVEEEDPLIPLAEEEEGLWDHHHHDQLNHLTE